MKPSHKTPKWLRRLQRESWNLELLISGFSIYLLFQGLGMIEGILDQLNVHYSGGSFSPVMLLSVIIFLQKVEKLKKRGSKLYSTLQIYLAVKIY